MDNDFAQNAAVPADEDTEVVARITEADEHVAIARRTVAKAEALLQQFELRQAETDRYLASRGLTREQVLAFKVPEELRERVEDELRRYESGLPPRLDETDPIASSPRFDSEETAGPAAGFRRLMRSVRI